MATQSDAAVTAADLVRNFGKWRKIAQGEPVAVTRHGKRTHVLISDETYQSLVSANAEAARAASFAPGTNMRALSDWLPDGIVIADADLNVSYVNRVAAAICRRRPDEMSGHSVFECLPEIVGTLMETHVRRTSVSGGPNSADIRSPFADGAWIRFQTFPVGDEIVILIRDITEDVETTLLAEVKEGILRAMSVHGGVGYLRLSLRHTIDRADEPFCRVVGLDEDRLLGVSVFDLIAREDKARVRDMLERVGRGESVDRFIAEFISNDGRALPMTVGAVSLHGSYGAGGSLLVTTPSADSKES